MKLVRRARTPSKEKYRRRHSFDIDLEELDVDVDDDPIAKRRTRSFSNPSVFNETKEFMMSQNSKLFAIEDFSISMKMFQKEMSKAAEFSKYLLKENDRLKANFRRSRSNNLKTDSFSLKKDILEMKIKMTKEKLRKKNVEKKEIEKRIEILASENLSGRKDCVNLLEKNKRYRENLYRLQLKVVNFENKEMKNEECKERAKLLKTMSVSLMDLTKVLPTKKRGLKKQRSSQSFNKLPKLYHKKDAEKRTLWKVELKKTKNYFFSLKTQYGRVRKMFKNKLHEYNDLLDVIRDKIIQLLKKMLRPVGYQEMQIRIMNDLAIFEFFRKEGKMEMKGIVGLKKWLSFKKCYISASFVHNSIRVYVLDDIKEGNIDEKKLEEKKSNLLYSASLENSKIEILKNGEFLLKIPIVGDLLFKAQSFKKRDEKVFFFQNLFRHFQDIKVKSRIRH